MEEKQFQVLDTYQDFQDYWSRASSKTIDEQVSLWQTSYMARYPELLDKQVRSYRGDNMAWEDIARRVFLAFPERLPRIQAARDNILASYGSVCAQARQRLGIDFAIALVVYVGIGCGAGWATTYGGQAAILLGLENIAGEKWHTRARLRGLISHEIGHLIHMRWRGEWGEAWNSERDPLFLLYREGFAQRCEHLINGKDTWHMAPRKAWLTWCERNTDWLAGEFLRRVRVGMPTNDFFGSWFSIRGKKQTGYFLGHALICEFEKEYSLRTIALLEPGAVRELALNYLESAEMR